MPSTSSKNSPPPIDILLGVQKDPHLLDGQARFEAINPFESYIVQAPAGSGKTALLTQRFLALLSQVAQPEHIVAMTFTKKAAAEMRDRIMGALNMGRLSSLSGDANLNEQNTWQLAKRVLQKDQEFAWGLLDNPNRLRIKTIDGLNSYLVGQMPLLSKMGAPSAILNDASPAYKEAVHSTLKDSSVAPEVGRLLRLVNGRFNRAESLLMNMLQKRDQWMGSLLGFAGDDARAYLEQALEHLVANELSQQVAHLSHIMPSLEEACTLAEFAVQHKQPQLEVLCGAWPLSDSLHDLEAWRVLADWLLTQKDELRKTVNVKNGFPAGKGTPKERKEQFLNVLSTLREGHHAQQVAESLAVLKSLPDPTYTQDQWDDLQGLIKLLSLSAAYLKWVFQSLGQADFIEIAQAATQSLGSELNPTDLAQQLDYQIQHLLVDEFQDTSSEQYALIGKLIAGWEAGDGRTLFIVGDPMQSIYRFREAEVGNFLKAWQGKLAQVTLKSIQLHVNFRSSQGIVDWVNQNFKKVLPAHNQIEKGAVCYSESHAFHQDKKGATSNAVTAHWGINRSDDEEAKEIVALIQQRVQAFSEGDGKSIALLGRTRSSLTSIARLLKQQNIAFRAVDLEGLHERQEVQDVLALSRALLHGSDRAAWIALLRSPLVGLSLTDLYVLMGENPYQSVWQCILDKQEDGVFQDVLSSDARQRLAFSLPILQQSLSRLGSLPFSVLVQETWLQLDGAQTVEHLLALENVEVFCQTLADFDGQPLDFEQLETLMQRLFARADSSPESQRIELMTMHKSKGLEFDTVILPGLGRKPRHDDDELISWFQFKVSEEGGGDFEQLVIAPIHQKGKQAQTPQDGESSPRLKQFLKRFESQKQSYEQGRLIYVAATRAKQQLHLFGQLNVKESEDTEKVFQPVKGSLLETLWPCIQQDFHHLIQAYNPEKNEREEGEPPELESDVASWPKVSRLPLPETRKANQQSFLALSGAPLSSTILDDEPAHESEPDAKPKITEPNTTEDQPIDSNLALLNTTLNTSVGNLVHAVLEQVAQEGIQQWPVSKVAEQLSQRHPFYQRWLKKQGLMEPELSVAMSRVIHSLSNALNNPKVRWALGEEGGEGGVLSDASTEYPLTSQAAQDEGGEINHHVIDRTFIDNKGVRWIIDYKTSVFEKTKGGEENQTQEAFIDYQITQYQPQLQRYGALFESLENRPQQWVLYFTYLDCWVVVEE